MTTPHSAHRGPTHNDDVVGVEVTIDGMLVIADRLNLMEFPAALGIRLNIPQVELRDIVWEQVGRDLTAQGVLDLFGEPHPEVAAMVDTLSRADRTLEGRWWRRDVGGKMVRFVVCRNLKGMPEGVDPLTGAHGGSALIGRLRQLGCDLAGDGDRGGFGLVVPARLDLDGHIVGHSQRMLAGPMPDAVKDQRNGQHAGGIGDLRCGPHLVGPGLCVGKSPVGAGSPA
jgi:hypothetical protein